MTDEIYEHMPKWRKLIRDLACEAGITDFLSQPTDQSCTSTENRDSSTTEDQPDHVENER